jgi:multidrug resistance efflux pump
VTPNVAGQVTEIDVQPNTLEEVGAILFQIERAPYQYKVKQLQSALAEARQKVERLKSNIELASADVKGGYLPAHLRRKEARRHCAAGALQCHDRVQASGCEWPGRPVHRAARGRARETNAKLALGSEIEGENTTVAQLVAQLDNAKWELDQTTVRASADGYVSTMALAVGARALPARSALSFILADDVTIVGVFSQNGFQSVKPGAPVLVAFANKPGHVYRAKVGEIVRGVGQGQIAVSGILARAETVGTSMDFPVRIDIPADMNRDMLRLGMVGTATVLGDGAGPIGILATILLWVSAYILYL